MAPGQACTGRRAFGLSAYLVAFALLLLVPSLGLGAAAAWQALRDYRAAFEERLRDTARALALALDSEIESHQATVAALAASSTLDGPRPDIAAFETEARRVTGILGTNVILLEAETMRQLVNTALPAGTRATGVTAADFRVAAETRRPLVSDVVIGAVSGRPVVGVAVPVERDGRIPYVLAARIEPARLAALLAAQGLGREEFATLRDGRGLVVARSRDHADYVGRAVPAWFAAATGGAERGIVVGPAIAGEATVFGFHRLRAAPNWIVVVGTPAASYRESWQGPLRNLAIGGGAALLLGTLLALLLARRLTRPVAALARRAQAVVAEDGRLAAGPTPDLPHSGIREIEALRIAFADAQRALDRRAAAERDSATALRESERRLRLVVAELNHRARNALATVQSLALQTARGPAGADPGEFTAAFTARLRTLARAHDLMTAFSWEGAALASVVRAGLAPWLEEVAGGGAAETAPAASPRILLGCADDPALPLLAPGQAQALVMALHELATNATKYGALSVPEGRVEVGCRAGPGGAASVEWRERNGPRLSGPPERQGFGTRLMQRALARDLGPGAVVALEFAPEGLRATMGFVPGVAAGAAVA